MRIALFIFAACLCCGCPSQQIDDRPVSPEVTVAPVETAPIPDDSFKICALPAAIAVDQQLPDIVEAVAQYWTEQGHEMKVAQPGEGCMLVFDVHEEALSDQGWGFKEAQTWIPNSMSPENPAICRFRLGFWVDPISSVELKAALAAHEAGHVLGYDHTEAATGELMSAIVTEDVAQVCFGGML